LNGEEILPTSTYGMKNESPPKKDFANIAIYPGTLQNFITTKALEKAEEAFIWKLIGKTRKENIPQEIVFWLVTHAIMQRVTFFLTLSLC
jgi:hypothetical protein